MVNDSRRLNRRELTGCFLTLSLTVPTVATALSAAAAPATGVAENERERVVKFHDGTVVRGSVRVPRVWARVATPKRLRKKRCAKALRLA
jgi:hypothetical protein